MTNAKWFTEVLMPQVLLEYLPLSSNAVDRYNTCDNTVLHLYLYFEKKKETLMFLYYLINGAF